MKKICLIIALFYIASLCQLSQTKQVTTKEFNHALKVWSSFKKQQSKHIVEQRFKQAKFAPKQQVDKKAFDDALKTWSSFKKSQKVKQQLQAQQRFKELSSNDKKQMSFDQALKIYAKYKANKHKQAKKVATLRFKEVKAPSLFDQALKIFVAQKKVDAAKKELERVQKDMRFRQVDNKKQRHYEKTEETPMLERMKFTKIYQELVKNNRIADGEEDLVATGGRILHSHKDIASKFDNGKVWSKFRKMRLMKKKQFASESDNYTKKINLQKMIESYKNQLQKHVRTPNEAKHMGNNLPTDKTVYDYANKKLYSLEDTQKKFNNNKTWSKK